MAEKEGEREKSFFCSAHLRVGERKKKKSALEIGIRFGWDKKRK